MMYITSKVTGNKKATITMATEKRLQELMNREHQSNEAKFLAWALEEYKCEHCGHIWSFKISRGTKITEPIQCPSCKRFTMNAGVGIKNFFSQMKKES